MRDPRTPCAWQRRSPATLLPDDPYDEHECFCIFLLAGATPQQIVDGAMRQRYEAWLAVNWRH